MCEFGHTATDPLYKAGIGDMISSRLSSGFPEVDLEKQAS
jgi:hypothetical protein